jgi:hypothetical protein
VGRLDAGVEAAAPADDAAGPAALARISTPGLGEYIIVVVMTTPVRAVAAFVLAFQLHQLTLPALCDMPDRPPTRCHETQASGASQVVGQSLSHELSCANRAMCGLLTTAIPEVAISLAAPDARSVAALSAPVLLPGDPSPPLSPPPQA